MLLGGTIADIDSLSAYFGPSAFLTFDRTYFHSLVAALLFSLLVTLPFLLRKRAANENPLPPFAVFLAAFAACVLHLLMDLCQSTGVELFWPFSPHRLALDWLPHLDLWIMGILLAGILLPMLSGLVTEEIGAKSKGPRGKVGASLALAASSRSPASPKPPSKGSPLAFISPCAPSPTTATPAPAGASMRSSKRILPEGSFLKNSLGTPSHEMFGSSSAHPTQLSH